MKDGEEEPQATATKGETRSQSENTGSKADVTAV